MKTIAENKIIRLYTDKEMNKLLNIPEEEILLDLEFALESLDEVTGGAYEWKVTTTSRN